MYAYVGGNPVSYTDSKGLQVPPAVLIVGDIGLTSYGAYKTCKSVHQWYSDWQQSRKDADDAIAKAKAAQDAWSTCAQGGSCSNVKQAMSNSDVANSNVRNDARALGKDATNAVPDVVKAVTK